MNIMTTEEIEKAAEDYSKEYWREVSEMTNVEESIIYSMDNFKAGVKFSNRHWQEKTRWKSLKKEPPTEYGYDTMYLLRTESGSPYLIPSLNNGSIKELVSYGFTEWKEIE